MLPILSISLTISIRLHHIHITIVLYFGLWYIAQLQHSHCKNKATPYQTLFTNLLEIYQTHNKHTMQPYHKLIKTVWEWTLSPGTESIHRVLILPPPPQGHAQAPSWRRRCPKPVRAPTHPPTPRADGGGGGGGGCWHWHWPQCWNYHGACKKYLVSLQAQKWLYRKTSV